MKGTILPCIILLAICQEMPRWRRGPRAIVTEGLGDCFQLAVDLELAEDVLNVIPGGRDADEERIGDLAGAGPVGGRRRISISRAVRVTTAEEERGWWERRAGSAGEGSLQNLPDQPSTFRMRHGLKEMNQGCESGVAIPGTMKIVKLAEKVSPTPSGLPSRNGGTAPSRRTMWASAHASSQKRFPKTS